MQLLQQLQMCNINSNSKFSIVTIEKWQEYQIEEIKSNININNNATTTQHKQECKEYYINLYIKKYMKKKPENLREKMQLIRTIKQNENLNPAEEAELENYILMPL